MSLPRARHFIPHSKSQIAFQNNWRPGQTAPTMQRKRTRALLTHLVIVVKVPDRNPPQEHTALDGPAADLVNGNLQGAI